MTIRRTYTQISIVGIMLIAGITAASYILHHHGTPSKSFQSIQEACQALHPESRKALDCIHTAVEYQYVLQIHQHQPMNLPTDMQIQHLQAYCGYNTQRNPAYTTCISMVSTVWHNTQVIHTPPHIVPHNALTNKPLPPPPPPSTVPVHQPSATTTNTMH